jgi:DNA-directed RNA polymerase alpha subunit
VLKRANIKTVGQLAQRTDEELLRLRGFGPSSLNHVRHALTVIAPDVPLKVTPPKTVESSTDKFSHIPLDLWGLSIDVLALSSAAHSLLEALGIWSLGQLQQLDLERLRKEPKIDAKLVQEIQETLSTVDFNELRIYKRRPVLALPKSLKAQSSPLSLTILNLSQATFNVLKQAKIETIEQLTDYSDQDLLHLRKFGTARLQEVHRALAAIAQDDLLEGETLSTSSKSLAHKLSPSLIEIIENLLAQLNQRDSLILTWRYGLDGNDPLTLEQIGQKLAITRERVRAIEERILIFLLHPYRSRFMRPLVLELKQALEEKEGMLSSVAAQELLCALGEYKPITPQSLLQFVLLFAKDNIKYINKPSIITLKYKPYNTYIPHLSTISRVFKSILKQARAPIEMNKMLSRFRVEYPEQSIAHEIPSEYLKRYFELHPDIEITPDNEYVLKRWVKTRLVDILMILREHGKPLHYSQIIKRLNENIAPEAQIGVRLVQTKLAYYDNIFVRVGHGIFGLLEWGLVAEAKLADGAVRVLREAGHPLTIKEIEDKVLETWHVRRNSIKAAVSRDPRIVKIAHNLYGLAD